MKNAIASVFCAVLLLLIARPALPQENPRIDGAKSEDVVARFNREVGKWKRSVASPSYGLMLFHGRVHPVATDTFSSPMGDEGIFFQGVDMRFFIGKNVSRRSGFYSGIESGIIAFIPSFIPGMSSFTDSVTVTDPGYTVWPVSYEARVRVEGALAFLMGKYGLKVDVGSPLYGLGLGVEMGMGLGIRSGGVQIFVGDRQNPTADADLIGGGVMCLLFDTALEASLRMGRNFRLFGKLGLVVLPFKDTVWDPMKMDRHALTDTSINSNEEYMRYALQNYIVEIDAFAYELRAGFALSFN